MTHYNPTNTGPRSERALIEAARLQASAALAVMEAERTSFSAFRAAVLQSRLVSPADLDGQIQQLDNDRAGREPSADDLARRLAGTGLLTRYQADQLLAGRSNGWRLGDCLILDRLGSGGMGTVYLAQQVKLGRQVALKVLPAALADDAEFVARFHREARAVARLKHPHVVQIYDVGEEAGVHFIVMELVRGTNLSDRLRQFGPLAVNDSIQVVKQVAEGLRHAFEHGLVHRDVKPANLIVEGASAKILDLGLARPLAPGETITGDLPVLGTPDYLSPEQFENPRAVDVRADLYALGCTWYALLAGHPPFAKHELLDKVAAHQAETPPAISELVPHVPEAVAILIHRLLAKNPDDRFQTPAELIQAIDALPSFSEPLLERIPLAMQLTTCPSLETLAKFDAGQLAEAEAAGVRLHLQFCEACRVFANDVSLAGETRVSASNVPTASHVSAIPQPPMEPAPVERTGVDPATVATEPLRQPASGQVCLKQLGQYEIHEVLGQGGMGAVYKARHVKLDKIVALKILPQERLEDRTAVERFEREMRAVGKLAHPNVVAAHDASESHGMHFLVMEYVDGVDLSELTKRLGPLPVAESCELIRQAAVGLQHASGRGLVHRDLKPSNLMLARSEDARPSLKILDLGLALLEEHAPSSQGELTTTGQFMGTWDYVAPEQALDTHCVDVRADIYSLGATLHKLLTGATPFPMERFNSPLQMMLAKTRTNAPSIQNLLPELPAELVKLIDRLLARDPEDRPATPEEIARALAPWAINADLNGLLQRYDAAKTTADGTEASLESGRTEARATSDDQGHGSGKSTAAFTGPASSMLDGLEKHDASAGLIAARQPAVTGGDSTAHRRRGPSGIRLAAGLAALLLLGVVIYLQTDKGTLEIVTEDPKAKVIVERNGQEITIDPGQGPSIRLDTGTWQVRMAEGTEELELNAERFTLKRGGKALVSVRKVQPTANANPVIPPPAATPLAVPSKATLARSSWFRPPPPLDPEWAKHVAELRPEAQVQEVLAELDRRNPGFDAKLRPEIANGRVMTVKLTAQYAADLTPLQALPDLSGFMFGSPNYEQSQLADLSPLKGLRLNLIWLAGHRRLYDVSPLRGMPLNNVQVTFCGVDDLSPLQDAPLRHIGFSHTPVRDLSVLKQGELEAFGAGGVPNHVHELTPLAGLPLNWLDANYSHVSDLTPLRGAPLEHVTLQKTRVADLSPLQGAPLKRIDIDYLPEREAFLRSFPTLETINRLPAAEFWKQLDEKKQAQAAWLKQIDGWLAEMQKLAPEERVKAVNEKLKERNPGFEGTMQADTVEADQVLALRITRMGSTVTDISPLRAFPLLRRLDLGTWDCPLHDISPLQGMPLESLTMGGTRVADLSPLRGMPLEYLAIYATLVSDLTPLRGMPLKNLLLGGTPVHDLNPLSECPLERLICHRTDVSDLTPLEGMKLQELDVVQSKVRDLSPLAGLPLNSVKVGGNPIDDLTPLAGLPLTLLHCEQTQVADLSPLQKMRTLKVLHVHHAPVKSLEPIKDLLLTELTIASTGVDSLAPLKGMPLENFWTDNTPISDLSPLAGMPLKVLGLGQTNVADVSLLRGMKLTALNLHRTPVEDLSPLTGSPLNWLNVRGSKVSDLSPIRDAPLRYLHYDVWNEQDLEQVYRIRSLSQINDVPTNQYWEAIRVWRERQAALGKVE